MTINWQEKIDHDNIHGPFPGQIKTKHDLLKKHYSRFKSTRKTGDYLGVSDGCVARHLKLEGIALLGVGGPNYKGHPDSLIARVRALGQVFCESHSIKEILVSLRVSPVKKKQEYLKKQLKKEGWDVFYERDL